MARPYRAASAINNIQMLNNYLTPQEREAVFSIINDNNLSNKNRFEENRYLLELEAILFNRRKQSLPR